MRRNRKTRIFVWPTLAATAIVVVLSTSETVQRRCVSWAPQPGSHPGVSGPSASTRYTIWPQPLESLTADRLAKRGERSLPLPAGIGPLAEAAGASRGAADVLRTEALLNRPQVAVAGARLHAPVRDEREELAGFEAATRGWGGLAAGLAVSHRESREEGSFSGGDAATGSTSLLVPRGARERGSLGLANRSSGGGSLGSSADEALQGVSPYWSGASLHGAMITAATERIAAGTENPSVDPLPARAALGSAMLRGVGSGTGMAWPHTPVLDEMLVHIARQPTATAWAGRVRQRLAALQSVPSLTDPRGGELLDDLQLLAEIALEAGEREAADRSFQQQLLRTGHALHRRVVVWKAVWRVGTAKPGLDEEGLGPQAGTEARAVSLRNAGSPAMLPLIEDVRRDAATTGDAEGWQQYLLLDQIARMAGSADAEQRRILAQRFLSRIEWDALENRQVQWLAASSVRQLASRIRPWAASPVDYASLLDQLERQESDAIDLGGINVATAVQTLRFAGDEGAVDVAEALNTYYRNANIRVAISAELLQRLLPEVPVRTTAIQHTIQGAPVHGTGRIQSQLQLRLVPDAQAWHLQLGTDGTVRSRTSTERGPVQVSNHTQAQFSASTPIRIDRQGLRVGDTEAAVSSHTRLGGMRTDFDGFPVIDSLVRGIAISQYEEAAKSAKRQSERLMRAEIESTVSTEVEQQISANAARLSDRLLGPLARLQLDPLVVDLETSESRLAVRYRVAGDWQLAAFTPRPRALSDSLLSLQVHQSALNNVFEQLTPSESPQPIRELAADLLEMFGAPGATVPEDMPRDVFVQFAPTRPITVEIEGGRLWMTLRIVRLTRDGGIDLSHFIVRAAYRAEVDGMQARLVRDGGLQISGPRMGMRERLPVRAIFNVVLSDSRPLPLVSEELAAHPAAAGLKVRDLALVDGWLGLAIGPALPTGGERVARVEE